MCVRSRGGGPARMTWAEVRRPTRASVVDDRGRKNA